LSFDASDYHKRLFILLSLLLVRGDGTVSYALCSRFLGSGILQRSSLRLKALRSFFG
jgi:hypothetical protein